MGNDTQWTDAQRLEGWAGEVRVNAIRLAAVLGFYGHHLVNVLLLRDDPSVAGAYHTAVTGLVLAWSIEVLALYICLSRRWVPPGLKYVASAADLVLVTALLVIGRDPRSMMVTLYFLVVLAAALRASLRLVYATTLGAMAAYAFFLGYVRYSLELPPEQRLSRPQQVVVILALGACGILAGQIIRQMHRLVHGYPVRADDKERSPWPSG